MLKHVSLIVCALFLGVSAFANVTVTAPANGVTLQSPVPFVASANSTTCAAGVAAMGIYTGPGALAYAVNGNTLNTTVNLGPGHYNVVVQEWDRCGGATTAPVGITVSAQSGVFVTSPAPNSSTGGPVHFAATAITTCPQGVAAMGIYPGAYQLAYAVNGGSLDYTLPMNPGKYNVVVQEWDRCGGASSTPLTITVAGGVPTFTNLQSQGGWDGAGQGPPSFIDCSPCGNAVTWAMNQGVRSPTLSGSAAQFNLAGSSPYWDVLFNNHLMGDVSSHGMPDPTHTLVPSLHNFTYDVYFYGANLELSQALEFDINQFFNGMGFIWGHECRIAGGHEWDIWDNVNQRWLPTGIPCNPASNAWNHLIIQVQRTANNQLLYQSITLNGVNYPLNQYYNPGAAPGWWGVTVNYQMDGNYKQSPYTVFLDQLNFSYQ